MDARGEGDDACTDDTVELRRALGNGPWVLEVGSPEGGHARLLRCGDRVSVGSGRGADLKVDDPAVSQCHCRLSVHADHVEIEDLRSKNGVYIGAVRVGTASVVDTGAFVIGRTSIVVRSGIEEDVPCADPVPGLVGGSLGLRRVAAEVRRHARTRAPVLLQGESGTGKDVVARALHQLSRRTGGYVPLNVGALPESLADAELFGHRRGAFTGALHSRPGAFEQASSGTLFLDEIADLPLSIQIKLLRVVEDGCVRPLGATAATQVDVRIVSASWASLEERVEAERFRADLYHRLATVVIQIPPLRQRKSDIPELSRALLRRIRDEVGEKQLTSAALSRLVSHDWPGNVRELGSVLYRAAMSAPASEIQSEHVQISSARAPQRVAPLGPEDASGLLREHHGNVSAAARAAGVARSTFRAWLVRGAPENAEA
ncbi:MAG TPA: sigma 54-interacting transcriptional regulator [Polyangiaceae bacterium]|nr:sigma 54-interacting transcriptional regulator [Polyangiaceae bacterium]